MPSPLQSTAHPTPHPALVPKVADLAEALLAAPTKESDQRVAAAKGSIARCAETLRAVLGELEQCRATLTRTDQSAAAEIYRPSDFDRWRPGGALVINGGDFVLTDPEAQLEDELFLLCDEQGESDLVSLIKRLDEVAARDEREALRRSLCGALAGFVGAQLDAPLAEA